MPEELQQETPPVVNMPPPSMSDIPNLPSGAAPLDQPQPMARPDVMGPNGGYQSAPSEVSAQPQSGLRHFITQATGSLLSGTVPHYYHDDQGNLQVEHVKEQPGQLFRRILASSILGGAVGAESGPSGIKGALRGAQAVGDKAEQMDAQARQRADQDFLARQKVAQEQRENQRLGMEQSRLTLDQNRDKREDAAASLSNIEHNLRMKQLQGQIQGQDYVTHQQAADQGKAEAESYRSVEAPAYTLGESEYKKILAADPSLSKFKWFPTSTRTYTYKDSEGKEQTGHENVWEAFNPDVKTSVTADEASRYKKVGVELTDEKTGAKIPLAAGYPLSPAQRAVVSKQYAEKAAPYEAAQMRELNARKEEATIKNLNSEAAMHYAQSVKAGRENAKDKKSDAVDAAKKAFEVSAQTNGLDKAIDGLSFGEKSTLAEYYRPVAIAQETAIRDRSNEIAKINDEINKSSDASERTKLASQRDELYQDRDGKIRQVQAIEKLVNSAFGVKPAPPPAPHVKSALAPPTPGSQLTKEAVDKYLLQNKGNNAAAQAQAEADGWDVTKPPISDNNLLGRVADVGAKIGEWTNPLDLGEKAGSAYHDWLKKPRTKGN